MQVVLATYGTRGDVEPMVALAADLREQGIDVRLCAPPDEELREVVGRAGVPVLYFHRPYRDFEQGLASEQRVLGVDGFVNAHISATHPVLEAAVAEGCDVLLATGMLHFVAGSVAKKAKVPHRFVVFTDWVLQPRPHHPLIVPALNAYRGALGLPPVQDPRHYLFTEHPWVAAEPLLSANAEVPGLEIVRTSAWTLNDQRPLAPELEDFLDKGSPPIVVGFGSMQVPPGFAQLALTTARDQGRRLVLLSGWSGLAIDERGDDALVAGEVNQQALFARAAAVVHHGGAGTTLTALRAGTPQVVIGQAADQSGNGKRVAELGIGVALKSPAPTERDLSAALEQVLDVDIQRTARARVGQVVTDGTARAAELLETAAGSGAAQSTA
ncbi:glycosyltransferase [Rhodococcus sp. H29-C3]|uniref:glycosyltransferase n=1 Tax=Rhodococcus sp. H29-C3 TaxID=3046307 RepID=UPI0024B8B0E6|nr:glycosyltransferase [Rhodococcus sp. H29-C3]MDJ0362452.1 glycosyltransferase [Rhodococcus sp. H29-C3]